MGNESSAVRASRADTLKDALNIQPAPEDGLSAAQSKKKRLAVAEEMLNTERAYVESLETLRDVYYIPLTAVIGERHAGDIFSTFPKILVFHQQLLGKLEEQISTALKKKAFHALVIGDLFDEVSSALVLYVSFINNYDNALNLLEYYHTKSAKRKQVKEIDDAQQGNNIERLLIMPVQRLPRYVLLLSELLKATLSKHKDAKSVPKTIERLKVVLHVINESKRSAEKEARLEELQKLVGKKPQLAENAGAWLVNEYGTEGGGLVLQMNNCVVLLSRKYKVKQRLPTSFLLLETAIDGGVPCILFKHENVTAAAKFESDSAARECLEGIRQKLNAPLKNDDDKF